MKKIAVLSDFHCHHSSETPHDSFYLSDQVRIPALHHPLQSLLDFIRDAELKADALVVPGDLTNKIHPQGLHSAWSAVQEIAAALNAESVAVTIGNHDVDSRRDLGSDPFELPRNFHPSFPIADET